MKKEKKQKQLSPKIQRQIEILSKYYDIDVEKRIITLELVFDKVSASAKLAGQRHDGSSRYIRQVTSLYFGTARAQGATSPFTADGDK